MFDGDLLGEFDWELDGTGGKQMMHAPVTPVWIGCFSF